MNSGSQLHAFPCLSLSLSLSTLSLSWWRCRCCGRYVDFQCISDPVRTLAGVTYHQAKASNIDLEEQLVHCRDIFKNHYFSVPCVLACSHRRHTACRCR